MSHHQIDFSAPNLTAPVIPAAASPPVPASQPRQQCWECLRRRWVCDAATPVCNKCRAAGIVCPGYSDRKPLTWLAPGRVTSRNRRPRAKTAADKAGPGRTPSTGSPDAAGEDAKKEARKPAAKPRLTKPRARRSPATASSSASPGSVISSVGSGSLSGSISGSVRSHVDHVRAMAPSFAQPGENSFTLSIRQPNLPEVKNEELPEYWPPQWSDQWSLDPSPTNQYQDPQVSKQWAEGISWELSNQNATFKQEESTIFVHPSLRLEITDFFEAATYYNEHIYPPLVANQLVPSQQVRPFTALEYMPPSIRHSLIALVIGHRILEMPRDESLGTSLARIGPGPVYGPAARMWWRLHHHMGLAVRYLNEDISSEETRYNDVTLAGIYVFLVAELHHSTSPHWRVHIDGLNSLINIRGGLVKLAEQAPHLRLVLLSFYIVCIMANTTGPSENQIGGAQHFNFIDTIADFHTGHMHPTLPCPLALFLDIIRINHVRHQVATDPSAVMNGSVYAAAREIMDDIFAFSPEGWAASFEFPRPEVLLVARLYKSAVMLYALSCLPTQPYGSLTPGSTPDSLESLASTKAYHYSRVLEMLKQASQSIVLERSLVWPTIVAGVLAVDGTQADRDFVAESLSAMANATGGFVLVAKWTLEKFWVSGKSGWDSCFPKQAVLLC